MNFKKILRETLSIKFDKAFGLDIGDRSAEIIELDKFFKFSLVTYGRTELPEGVVENGKIMNQAVLAEKIKSLLKEVRPKKVSTNKVIVSLPESQIFIKCFEVDSHLKSGALIKTIYDKMSLSLPINIDKTYWDFTEKSLADRTKKMIMFISVPKDIANSYVKFCNSIGLEVVSLSTESLSLARIILKSYTKHSLIIDIGSQATNLSFFDGDDEINMFTTIPVAGEQMTLAVKNGLKIEKAEAEALKVKFGFVESVENVVRPIILPVIDDISKEIKLAIEYYEMTFKQKLDNIYIIGGSALLPAITDIFKVYLNREVKIAVSGYDINLSSMTGKANPFPLFANVIGLGMLGASGQFKDMNFLKKMPNSEINLVNKLDLLKLGYLSKTNTIRTIINNKYVMVLAVILFLIGFFVLLQIARNFNLTADSATYQ
jgi:type IV pilus assembly protein PilM